MRDYYEVLGIDRSAGTQEIKQAYLKRARELHPDLNPDPQAEEEFKAVGEAYEVLSDPQKRDLYDKFGHEGLRNAGGLGDFNPFDLFSSIFGGSFFGFNQGPEGPPPGADREIALKISFEESVFGTKKTVSLKGYRSCSDCEASGAEAGTTPATCIQCDGMGRVKEIRQTFLLGQTMTLSPCGLCEGTGKYTPSPCPECSGKGRIMEDISFELPVPGGVNDGSILRLSGKGDAGIKGGIAGDLYVVLRASSHPNFEKSGDDLVSQVRISMFQAALGCDLTIDTLDGEKALNIKAGTQNGDREIMKGLGIIKRDGKKRGNLILNFYVEIPKNLDKKEAKLLKEAAELYGEDL